MYYEQEHALTFAITSGELHYNISTQQMLPIQIPNGIFSLVGIVKSTDRQKKLFSFRDSIYTNNLGTKASSIKKAQGSNELTRGTRSHAAGCCNNHEEYIRREVCRGVQTFVANLQLCRGYQPNVVHNIKKFRNQRKHTSMLRKAVLAKLSKTRPKFRSFRTKKITY